MTCLVNKSIPQVSLSSIWGFPFDYCFFPAHIFLSCLLISELRQILCISGSLCWHSTFCTRLGHSLSQPFSNEKEQKLFPSGSYFTQQTQLSPQSTGCLRLCSLSLIIGTLCGGVGTYISIYSYYLNELGTIGHLVTLVLYCTSYFMRRAKSLVLISTNFLKKSFLMKRETAFS